MPNLAPDIGVKIMLAWLTRRSTLARARDQVARLELELEQAKEEAEALRMSLALAMDLATAYRDQASSLLRLQ
jgi:hypothetical protein